MRNSDVLARFKGFLCRFAVDNRGATAIEYALIAAGIAMAIIAAVSAVGETMRTDYYDEINAGLQ